MSKLLQSKIKQVPNRYEQQKLQAIADCKTGRFVEAESLLGELLDVLRRYGGSVENSEVMYWYLVARHRGDTRKAMDEFMRPGDVKDKHRPSPPLPDQHARAMPLNPSPDPEAPLRDERFVQAIALLTKNMGFPPSEFFQGRVECTESAAAEAVTLLGELKSAYPDSASVHAAYAFALELAGKAMSAVAELDGCCERFPNRWELDLIRRREWLWVVNPLKLLSFDALHETIHPAINANLISDLIVLTRDGVLPRAVWFLKDSAGDFDPRQLRDARMVFTTIISPVSAPQVVAVMGRIFDNPSNPYNLEALDAPFRPPSHHRRVTFEFFVRQDSFDFVIVDHSGRVIHTRKITFSDRMAAVHRELQSRFDSEPGEDTSWEDLASAYRRHQALVDQNSVQY